MEVEWESPDDEPAAGRRLTVVAVVLIGVAVVGMLARSPATTPDRELAVDGGRSEPTPAATAEADEPAPSPQTPSPTATASPPRGDPAFLGLDQVLPVAEGDWSQVPVELGGQPADGGPLPVHMVWAADEVVVLAGGQVAALDPATGRWRDLPPLPQDLAEVDRRVVAIGDGVLVAEQRFEPGLGSEVRPASGWLLGDVGWTPVPDIPGTVIGAIDGAAVTARYAFDPDDGRQLLGMTTFDPASGTVVDLPPVPIRFEPWHAVQVPDGFLTWGVRIGPGQGTQQDPVAVSVAVLRWSVATGEWTVLPPAPVQFDDAAWVPGPAGSAGRLVVAGQRTGSPGAGSSGPDVAGAVLDLDRDVWTSEVELPLDDADVHRLESPSLSVTWDGQGTVWAYGGYAAPVQLAYHLPTGVLSVARPTGPRVNADLVWHDGRLILLGGFGSRGQVTEVAIWEPAG